MEVLLSYNWNVYKLFSNGNRAKAPFAVVEGEDCESDGFMSKDKIMRADLPQEERADVEKEKNLVLRNRVLSTKINALGLDLQNKRTTGALVMSGDTNWKWQWCVLRMSSNQFIAALSPEFDTTEGAQEWMKSETERLTR